MLKQVMVPEVEIVQMKYVNQLENGSVTALSSGEVSVRSAEAAPPDLSSQK